MPLSWNEIRHNAVAFQDVCEMKVNVRAIQEPKIRVGFQPMRSRREELAYGDKAKATGRTAHPLRLSNSHKRHNREAKFDFPG